MIKTTCKIDSGLIYKLVFLSETPPPKKKTTKKQQQPNNNNTQTNKQQQHRYQLFGMNMVVLTANWS